MDFLRYPYASLHVSCGSPGKKYPLFDEKIETFPFFRPLGTGTYKSKRSSIPYRGTHPTLPYPSRAWDPTGPLRKLCTCLPSLLPSLLRKFGPLAPFKFRSLARTLHKRAQSHTTEWKGWRTCPSMATGGYDRKLMAVASLLAHKNQWRIPYPRVLIGIASCRAANLGLFFVPVLYWLPAGTKKPAWQEERWK